MARPLMIGRSVLRHRAAAAVLWTPLNLGSALVAWWDPTQGLTMNGSSVASWTDRVGGVVASQSTASAQPGYSATARNGKPGLTFSGSQWLDFTPSSSFPSGGALGSLVVAAYYTSTDSEAIAMFYGNGGTDGGLTRYIGARGGGVIEVGISGENLEAVESWTAVDRLVIGVFNGAAKTGTGYIDGNAAETYTYNNAINTSLTTGSLGRWSAYGADITGVGQQFMVLSGSQTASQLAKIAGWQSWNDGKAGSNLPAGHPYKSRAPYVSDP